MRQIRTSADWNIGFSCIDKVYPRKVTLGYDWRNSRMMALYRGTI